VASKEEALEAAVERTADRICGDLGTRAPDLVVVFSSVHHADAHDRLPDLVGRRLNGGLLVGCSAGGVIGGAREVEQEPGLSITAAVLPGVTVRSVHLRSDDLPTATAPLSAWESVLEVRAAERPHFLLLPDPFSFDPEPLLHALDRFYPDGRKIGGLASGGRQLGANALFLAGHVHRSGLVGVSLCGDIEVDTIVAQGCRPIGQPMFVTRSDRNIIWELDGRRPLDVLQQLHETLDQRDRALARHSLFVGIVMNEDQQQYEQGDFLIRNLVGVDAASGALAVGALIEDNSVVQFHLRDAKTSAEDLEELLTRYERRPGTRPRGSLLFSCLGRGRFLYGEPDHDTDAFRRHLGEIPLGGFFCNGEIGPVHGTTFLHGYTSAFGLFGPRR
jgi:small ligand-binding sensory domain FIST